MLELLLAYSLTMRIFEGDLANPEFAWCLTTLCPMLSALEANKEPEEAVVNFINGSLTFPLYRNWNLTVKAIQDTEMILQSKASILKALVGIKIALDRDECRYIFSRIALNDYCGWLQSNSFDEELWKKLADEFSLIQQRLDKSWFSLCDLAQVEELLNSSDE
jgi:protein SHQ1